jgi:hypothetical protein
MVYLFGTGRHLTNCFNWNASLDHFNNLGLVRAFGFDLLAPDEKQVFARQNEIAFAGL